jgi:hypothetical protein
MSDEIDELKKKLKQFKPAKKKLSIPKELLNDAKSYEDKLAVIKTVSEREMKRVIMIVKDMLKDDLKNKK